MPSISEILKGKTARDEARVTELRAERESLSYMRDGAWRRSPPSRTATGSTLPCRQTTSGAAWATWR